jgi:hypothetical protein
MGEPMAVDQWLGVRNLIPKDLRRGFHCYRKRLQGRLKKLCKGGYPSRPYVAALTVVIHYKGG